MPVYVQRLSFTFLLVCFFNSVFNKCFLFFFIFAVSVQDVTALNVYKPDTKVI